MQASRHCFPVSKKLGLLLAGAGLSAATSSLRDRTRDMPGLGGCAAAVISHAALCTLLACQLVELGPTMHVAVMSGVGERLLNYKSATSCDDERICVAVRCARMMHSVSAGWNG
eukprot:1142488-Pelagomonas_calceolata.AAC.11